VFYLQQTALVTGRILLLNSQTHCLTEDAMMEKPPKPAENDETQSMPSSSGNM
jgi:hypothetical protein